MKYYLKLALIGVAFGITIYILAILVKIDWLQNLVFFICSAPAMLQIWFKIDSELLSLILVIIYFTGLCMVYGRIRLFHRKNFFTIILTMLVILLHLRAYILFAKIGDAAGRIIEYLGNR